MVFTKRVSIRGRLLSSYVFQNQTEVNNWLEDVFPRLQAKYNNDLTYEVSDLDGLKVGDKCCVIGDGDEVYEILGMKVYSKNRYGFILDSGWVEEVAKCYKPRKT